MRSWGAALLLVLATAGLHEGMDTSSPVRSGRLFVPGVDEARISALGFDLLVSDFHWLQALQLVGGKSQLGTEDFEAVARLIGVVTGLDPWVGHPYRFAAVWLTDSDEDVRTANRLLARGAAYSPGDWRNHFYLGFNHFFYLDDPAAAVRALRRALPLPGAPRYLELLALRLEARASGDLETAEAFLRQLHEAAESDEARHAYELALYEIRTERHALLLDRAREVFRARHGRDIERVEELLEGPEPVLTKLPPAYPDGNPRFHWVIEPERGRIVSSFYHRRYEPHKTRRHEPQRKAASQQTPGGNAP